MASTIAIGHTLLLILHLIYVVQSFVRNATGDYYYNFQSDIDCSNDNCVVICNEQNGCKDLNINAKYAQYLIIECSAFRSCDSMLVTHGAFQNTSITCTGDMSCVDAHFETSPTKGVYLKCLNTGTEETQAPCYRTSLSARHDYAARAEVTCKGSPGCKYVNFEIGSYKSFVFMDGLGPMHGSTINASGSVMTSLICTSTSDVPSTDYVASYFFVPSRLYLSFYGAGCDPFGTLISATDFTEASLAITGCGDSKCSSGKQCLPSFDLTCNDGKKDRYNDSVCGSSNCGCDDLVELAEDKYVKSSDMCSEFFPSSNKEKSSKSSLDGTAIACVVIGVVVMLLVIVGVVWYLVLPVYRDKKRFAAPFINVTDELDANAGDYSAPNQST